jgi:bacteriorhodopsin
VIVSIISKKNFFAHKEFSFKKFSRFSASIYISLVSFIAFILTCFFVFGLVKEDSHKKSFSFKLAKIFVSFFSFVVYFSTIISQDFII